MKEKSSPVGLKKQLASIVILVLLIGITYYSINEMFSNISPRDLWQHIVEANLVWLGLAFVCMLLYIFFEGMSISSVASALGERVHPKRGVVYAAADLYFSALTPSATGGQPASIYYMTKRGGGVSRATTTMIVNVIMYTLTLLFFAVAVLIFKPGLFFDRGRMVIVLSIIGFALCIILIAVCLAFMFSDRLVKKVGIFVINLFVALRIFKNKEKKLFSFAHTLKEYKTCVSQIRHIPKALILSFLFNVLHRISYFTIAYCIYRSFNLNDVSYLEMVALQIVITISVTGIPIPGAVGISEAVSLSMYKVVYRSLAPCAVVITRAIGNYLCYILCGIISLREQLKIGKLKDKEE